MIYSVHTFELTLNPATNKFNKLKNRAYEKSKGKYRVFSDENKYIDTALSDKGIKIEYHDNRYKKKVKLIVNPTRVLGGDDVLKLWKPNQDNISKLLHRLEKQIEGYFNSKYTLDDFRLTRIDFTINLDVGSRENVASYIKVLHKLGKVKGFGYKYDDNDERIDKNLSYDLEGNSNGVEFTAYDKEAASGRTEAKGILRVEARLTKQKAISACTNESIASKQIQSLALNSKDIFLTTFVRIVPYGDYYKKKDAVKIIKDKISTKKQKEKMLKLLTLIPQKKSLCLAQKEMKDRNMDKVMKQFAEINLSPVTISKQQKVKHLKNLYAFFV